MNLSVQGNLIRFRSAQYWTSGAWAPITSTVGATLSVSLINSDTAQTPVANAQNVPMTLDAPTQCDWSCILPSGAVLTDGSIYYVLVNVAIGGVTGTIKQKFVARFPPGGSTPD